MKLISRKTTLTTPRRQGGAALLVALMMLIMVSLLAAGGFFLSTTEARGAAGWSDRQRALFTAEGALVEGQAVAKALVASAPPGVEHAVEQLVRAKGTGYYVRTDGTFPEINPWPKDKSIAATAKDSRVTNVYYMIVYEGAGVAAGPALATGVGSPNKLAEQPRFTIYAQAGGIKDGTNVVLSTSTAF